MKFLSDLLKAILAISITIQLSVLAFNFIDENETVFAETMRIQKETTRKETTSKSDSTEEKELKGKDLIDARLIVSEEVEIPEEEKIEYSIDEAEEKIKEENDKGLKESKESKRAIITRTQIAKKRKENLEKEENSVSKEEKENPIEKE